MLKRGLFHTAFVTQFLLFFLNYGDALNVGLFVDFIHLKSRIRIKDLGQICTGVTTSAAFSPRRRALLSWMIAQQKSYRHWLFREFNSSIARLIRDTGKTSFA